MESYINLEDLLLFYGRLFSIIGGVGLGFLPCSVASNGGFGFAKSSAVICIMISTAINLEWYADRVRYDSPAKKNVVKT